MDDACWAVRGDAKSIAQVYLDNGCAVTPAGKGPGSRIAGWQRIHSYLAEAPACPHHRAKGWDTCPRFHMFSTCEHLWSELSSLPHATTGNPEDADTKAPDHISDALRYATAGLGTGAQFVILADPAPEPGFGTYGQELLAALGPTYGVRPDPLDPWRNADQSDGDEDRPQPGRTQRSPFS